MPAPTLRHPEFGNTFTQTLNTRVHRTLNGNLRKLQGNAPTWQGFSIKIVGLDEDQVAAFKLWVFQNLGREVTWIDHENRKWVGLITSPHIEVSHGKYHLVPIDSLGNIITDGSPPASMKQFSCENELGFEFEGQVTINTP